MKGLSYLNRLLRRFQLYFIHITVFPCKFLVLIESVSHDQATNRQYYLRQAGH